MQRIMRGGLLAAFAALVVVFGLSVPVQAHDTKGWTTIKEQPSNLTIQAGERANVPSSAAASGLDGNASGDISLNGSKCATVWTSNRAGSIYVCWTWYLSSDGVNYYGSFWGTFYDHAIDDRWVILQAKWYGRDWTPLRTAQNGGNFSGDYSGLRNLTFRACLTGGYCGAAA
ncbi:hypothetical protein GCM10027290_43680 [Micromonospora sonneratiae]|uniref:Peptidase inhibitor family I36 n=1 Tax=Micromonospora sonneratiae TaxID=1184706 RepID=A0ABW3Y9J6_9ACTN